MHADTWKEGGVLFFSLIKRIYDGVKCNEKKKLLLPCLLHIGCLITNGALAKI